MKALLFLILFPFLQARAQSSFEADIASAAKQLFCAEPDEAHPVQLNAALVQQGDSMAVIIKVALASGYHIYQYVPPSLPYIPIEHILQVPENIRSTGNWNKTPATISASDPGVLIYERGALFTHKMVKKNHEKLHGIIRTGLYFQTCNLRQCLPPEEKIFDLAY